MNGPGTIAIESIYKVHSGAVEGGSGRCGRACGNRAVRGICGVDTAVMLNIEAEAEVDEGLGIGIVTRTFSRDK